MSGVLGGVHSAGGTLAVALALAAAGSLRAQPRVAVELPAAGVEFGAKFELRIERSWPRDHSPQPFDVLSLLPLEAREVSAEIVTAGDRLVETRRFEAAAWQLGELALGPFVLRTRDGSMQQHSAEPAATRLFVRSSLPEPPGPIEWPGDVRDRSQTAAWLLPVAILLALGIGGLAFVRWRRPPVASEPEGPSATALARREIEALQAPGDELEELAAYYVALAEIVRRYAQREYAIRAFVHTSEELVAAVPHGGDPLRDCLFACDLVKFAADRPAAARHAEARARAIAFVQAAGGPQ